MATTVRQRAEVRRLKAEDATLTLRAIAERTGLGKTTVERILKAPEPERPLAPPEPGNGRAVTHGATAEQRLAPLRDKHVAELAARYPHLDDHRRTLAADRMARLESASAWLEGQGGVVRDAEGEVFPVVDRVERWATRMETLLADFEREARELAVKQGGLEAYLAGDGDDVGEDAGSRASLLASPRASSPEVAATA